MKFFHLLIEFLEFWVSCKLFRDVERHQEFCKVRSLFQGIEVFEKIVVDGIDDFSVAIQKAVFPIGTKVRFVGENLQELSDLENDLLGLCLSGVDTDIRVEVFENLED